MKHKKNKRYKKHKPKYPNGAVTPHTSYTKHLNPDSISAKKELVKHHGVNNYYELKMLLGKDRIEMLVREILSKH